MDPKPAQTAVQPDLNSILSQQTDQDIIYDVAIIGGGPAGAAAAVYCGRKMLKTLLLTENFNGQSIVSGDIENWIGEQHISGVELAQKLENHVRVYSEVVDIKLEKVVSVKSVPCKEGRICDFEIIGQNKYRSKTVIVASGAKRKKLGVSGEEKFTGKGVSYCSICDAPLFRGKKVAVVGGGNAGFEAIHDLGPYASEIYLLDTNPEVAADQVVQDEVRKNHKLQGVFLNAKVKEIIGDSLVSAIKYEVPGEGAPGVKETTLEVDGVFIEIGSVPNSEIVKNLVQTDEYGQIMINFQHARTSHPGVFAAGDVTNDPYKQNNIAVGDGVRAALSAYHYLFNREKQSPAAEK